MFQDIINKINTDNLSRLSEEEREFIKNLLYRELKKHKEIELRIEKLDNYIETLEEIQDEFDFITYGESEIFYKVIRKIENEVIDLRHVLK